MKEKGSMMNRTVKSAVAMAAVAAMSLGALAACGSSTSGDDAKGKVYYLNFKPEGGCGHFLGDSHAAIPWL